MQNDHDDDRDDRKQRENLMVLGIAVALIVGSVWLLIKYKEYREESDCFLAGHHNCAPVDMSNQ
jgi:hypothetical protein